MTENVLDIVSLIVFIVVVPAIAIAIVMYRRSVAKKMRWRKEHGLRSEISVCAALNHHNHFEWFIRRAQGRIKDTMPWPEKSEITLLSMDEIDDLGWKLSEIMQASGCKLVLFDKVDKYTIEIE